MSGNMLIVDKIYIGSNWDKEVPSLRAMEV